MNGMAHLVGSIALFLAGACVLRTLTRGPLHSGRDVALLQAAGVLAGVAVLLHALATDDDLIAVLAVTWMAFALRALWGEYRRVALMLARDRAAPGAKEDHAKRPVLVVLRGGREPRARRAGPVPTSRP